MFPVSSTAAAAEAPAGLAEAADAIGSDRASDEAAEPTKVGGEVEAGEGDPKAASGSWRSRCNRASTTASTLRSTSYSSGVSGSDDDIPMALIHATDGESALKRFEPT